MKVLQVNASYKPAYIYGGPTMSVAALTEQLKRSGQEVEIFTTTANGHAELPVKRGDKINVDGVDVTYFKRITKDHSHFSPALLAQLWRRVKEFDIIHIHAWWNLVSVGACLVARMRRVPVIVSPRGTLSIYTFSHKNSFMKRLFHETLGKWLLNGCVVHVTSDQEKKAIKLLLRPKQVINIANLVSIPTDLPDRSEHRGFLRLIFLSRVDAKKGIDLLIDALPSLDIPYRLTIAGDGNELYLSELKQKTHDQNVADKIDWVGFVYAEEKFKVLACHDLLVLPSHDENFGNIVIESLSVGTPVLISEQVGLASYVSKNNLGWTCNINAASISRQINAIGKDLINQQEISKRAPGIIRKDFAAEALINEYIDIYETALR